MTDLYTINNELGDATNELSEVNQLLWVVCDMYFDRSPEAVDKGCLIAFYDRYSTLVHMAAGKTFDLIKIYHKLSDEIAKHYSIKKEPKSNDSLRLDMIDTMSLVSTLAESIQYRQDETGSYLGIIKTIENRLDDHIDKL